MRIRRNPNIYIFSSFAKIAFVKFYWRIEYFIDTLPTSFIVIKETIDVLIRFGNEPIFEQYYSWSSTTRKKIIIMIKELSCLLEIS